ncbi:glycosyltransferase family 2 protein [Candidatus Bipolaricaulota sp. J31]
MPRVTVVIPTLNEAGNLRRCLRALAAQSFGDFEVIVVDGGSSDGTVDVARSFGARVIAVRERGIARARQAGFEAAAGEIIASTDADAGPPPEWLARLIAPFSDPEVVATCGPFRYEGWWDLLSGNWISNAARPLLFRLGFTPLPGPNFAVRREEFLAVGGFRLPDGSFPQGYPDYEDILLGLKLRRRGKIVLIRDLWVTNSPRRFPRGMLDYLVRGNLRLLTYVAWVLTGKI